MPDKPCKLYGIEFVLPKGRKWWRASITMHDREALMRQGEALAKENGWLQWRIVEV